MQNDSKQEEAIKALTKIDDTSNKLQSRGYDREAIDCMQLGLLKRHDIFGPNSTEFVSQCKEVVKTCNSLALKCTSLDKHFKFQDAVDFLNFALTIAKHDQVALTLGNLAQVYAHKGEYTKALKYLEEAKIAGQSQLGQGQQQHQQHETANDNNVIDYAKTHLNMCAILSTLGKHSEALENANNAIQILKQNMQCKKSSSSSSSLETVDDSSIPLSLEGTKQVPPENGKNDLIRTVQEERNITNKGIEFIETLAISYYNVGVEYEHLGCFKKSCDVLREGIEIAQFLDGDHQVTKSLKDSYQAIGQKLAFPQVEERR